MASAEPRNKPVLLGNHWLVTSRYTPQLMSWVFEHCHGGFYSLGAFVFSNEDDAVLFKLAHGGKIKEKMLDDDPIGP